MTYTEKCLRRKICRLEKQCSSLIYYFELQLPGDCHTISSITTTNYYSHNDCGYTWDSFNAEFDANIAWLNSLNIGTFVFINNTLFLKNATQIPVSIGITVDPNGINCGQAPCNITDSIIINSSTF